MSAERPNIEKNSADERITDVEKARAMAEAGDLDRRRAVSPGGSLREKRYFNQHAASLEEGAGLDYGAKAAEDAIEKRKLEEKLGMTPEGATP